MYDFLSDTQGSFCFVFPSTLHYAKCQTPTSNFNFLLIEVMKHCNEGLTCPWTGNSALINHSPALQEVLVCVCEEWGCTKSNSVLQAEQIFTTLLTHKGSSR